MQHDWPVADPFVSTIVVRPGDIDAFGHVNNIRYVEWAMDIAWAHSEAVGLAFDAYRRMGAGCVVHRHEFTYTRPALVGEEIAAATWIAANDGRVRLVRGFEFRRATDGAILFTGATHMVCVDLDGGKPRRMPPDFVERYVPAAAAPKRNA